MKCVRQARKRPKSQLTCPDSPSTTLSPSVSPYLSFASDSHINQTQEHTQGRRFAPSLRVGQMMVAQSHRGQRQTSIRQSALKQRINRPPEPDGWHTCDFGRDTQTVSSLETAYSWQNDGQVLCRAVLWKQGLGQSMQWNARTQWRRRGSHATQQLISFHSLLPRVRYRRLIDQLMSAMTPLVL
uniref:Uncharacterized protein n=1 Tax=Craspedostauros australis TaxID=1486917 RepID=A0A7R9ZPW4_9STRA|mmetsp:Transcript_5341/g.14453  ORF Transcript_5341/g.14453 Transcript_5341/m.14453 type:complete len:184 (+) Transcript_5341:732-1283(+)